jgi:Tol biopolymer transport system component
VYLASPDGRNVRPIPRTTDAAAFHGWSHDGRRVIFSRWRRGIFSVGTDGRSPRLLRALTSEHDHAAAMSTTRMHVLVRRELPDAETSPGDPDLGIPEMTFSAWELHVMDMRTGKLTRLTRNTHFDVSWLPRGRRVTYTEDVRPGRLRTIVVDANGRNRRAMAWLAEPDWTPDEKLIAYRTPGGIYVVNADGSGMRPLSREARTRGREGGSGEDSWPVWAPDGSRLVYQDGGDLVVVSRDGKRERRVTDPGGAGDYCPAWSPNGRRIAFVRSSGRMWDNTRQARMHVIVIRN